MRNKAATSMLPKARVLPDKYARPLLAGLNTRATRRPCKAISGSSVSWQPTDAIGSEDLGMRVRGFKVKGSDKMKLPINAYKFALKIK
jgi:hypothetical protein